MSNTNSKEYREVIARLIKARKEAGLTQVQVAEELGKPQSFVSKVESRERRLDITELKQLAKIYKVSVSDLI